MLRALLAALLALAILTTGNLYGQDKDKAAKDKATKDRAEPPAGKVVTAKVKAVDEAKSTITVTTADRKDVTYQVTNDTKIVGPRGGVSEKRLKDDRLAKDMEVTITPSADGKTAVEIKLAVRPPA